MFAGDCNVSNSSGDTLVLANHIPVLSAVAVEDFSDIVAEVVVVFAVRDLHASHS